MSPCSTPAEVVDLSMTDWEIIHAYRRAVEAGRADPLYHSCGTLFVTKIGRNDEPVLHCYFCPASVTPGAAWLERLEKESKV